MGRSQLATTHQQIWVSDSSMATLGSPSSKMPQRQMPSLTTPLKLLEITSLESASTRMASTAPVIITVTAIPLQAVLRVPNCQDYLQTQLIFQ